MIWLFQAPWGNKVLLLAKQGWNSIFTLIIHFLDAVIFLKPHWSCSGGTKPDRDTLPYVVCFFLCTDKAEFKGHSLNRLSFMLLENDVSVEYCFKNNTNLVVFGTTQCTNLFNCEMWQLAPYDIIHPSQHQWSLESDEQVMSDLYSTHKITPHINITGKIKANRL